MRFGFYTDIHYSGKGPKRRKDDYPKAVERKHRHIYRDGQMECVEFFVSAGDINEYHTVANSVLNRQFTVMREERSVPEYGILGNHDVLGNNSERVDLVSVSTLYSSGFITRLSKTEPTRIEGEDGTILALFGVDIHKDMDNLRPEDYYVEKPYWADYTILVAHGMVRERAIDLPYVRQTTFSQIVETGTQADLILTGHDHNGYGIIKKTRTDGGTVIFHNPGSPVRIKASEAEMERTVGYSLIDLTKEGIKITFMPFPSDIALPAEEVLDRETLLEEIRLAENRVAVQNKFENFSISSISLKDVIIEIATSDNISEGAKIDLVRRLEDEELKLAQRELTQSV